MITKGQVKIRQITNGFEPRSTLTFTRDLSYIASILENVTVEIHPCSCFSEASKKEKSPIREVRQHKRLSSLGCGSLLQPETDIICTQTVKKRLYILKESVPPEKLEQIS